MEALFDLVNPPSFLGEIQRLLIAPDFPDDDLDLRRIQARLTQMDIDSKIIPDLPTYLNGKERASAFEDNILLVRNCTSEELESAPSKAFAPRRLFS